MRANTNVWWIIGGFFLLMGTIYTVWNILRHSNVPWPEAIEWAGTVGLFFLGFMGLMVGYWLEKTYRAQGGELPEDIVTADIDDGDPELGEFSPWSWWPLVLASSAGIFIIGLAVGQFLLPVGVAIFVVAIVGWVYEYYRGYFAR